MRAAKSTSKPARFRRATRAAIAKARELGYAGLADLDVRGTSEHKAIVVATHKERK